TTLLTNNLSLVVDAPNGVHKLRELVLGLAVRGKLVPQEKDEGCAESLLQKLRAAALEGAGSAKARREAVGAPVKDGEAPYRLPRGWVWARIADTGRYINGLAFKPG